MQPEPGRGSSLGTQQQPAADPDAGIGDEYRRPLARQNEPGPGHCKQRGGRRKARGQNYEEDNQDRVRDPHDRPKREAPGRSAFTSVSQAMRRLEAASRRRRLIEAAGPQVAPCPKRQEQAEHRECKSCGHLEDHLISAGIEVDKHGACDYEEPRPGVAQGQRQRGLHCVDGAVVSSQRDPKQEDADEDNVGDDRI